MNTIKGITWDHPRGFDSIVAATEQFHKNTDTCRIVWDKRSLTEFGDLSLAKLTDKYDLLIIDHPFVGEAHTGKLLMPLEKILSNDFLENQSQLHIGPCYASYAFEGHQYALPIDAAAQCCAINAKQITPAYIPTNWEEYLDGMRDRNFSKRVLWPLCPTDLWCSFLTLMAQLGRKNNCDVFVEEGLNVELTLEALDLLKQLTENVALECMNMNPIETLVKLAEEDYYLFCPLIFGYNNYSRSGSGQIEFANALCHKGQLASSVLGGAGIAVSSKSIHHIEIKEFLQFIMRDEILSGPYFEAGGQPSLKSSWSSNILNDRTLDFFNMTFDTINSAYTRPRFAGFNSFQNEAAQLMHGTMNGFSGATIVRAINNLYHMHCH